MAVGELVESASLNSTAVLEVVVVVGVGVVALRLWKREGRTAAAP